MMAIMPLLPVVSGGAAVGTCEEGSVGEGGCGEGGGVGGGIGGATIVVVVVKAAAFTPRALAKAEGVKAACWLARALCAPADAAVPSVTVMTSASTEVTVVETVPSALDATPRLPARAVVSTVEAARLPVLPSPSSLVTSKLPVPD